MKALVCDLCGCMVPDVPEASLIQGVTITRGGSVVLERDVCLTCLEKLIMGFESIDFAALQGTKAVPGTVSAISDPDFTPGVSEAIDFTLAMAELKQTSGPAPEANKVAPGAIKDPIRPSGTFPEGEGKQITELKTVICQQCGNSFESRSPRSKFCSKKCVNDDYTARTKNGRTPEVNALMNKLKAESRVPIERPNIYHEM